MISNKEQLKEYLLEEKEYYKAKSKKDAIIRYITGDIINYIWKYQKTLRKTEYWYNKKRTIISNIGYLYFRRKKNKIGIKLGIEMHENTFDKGLIIFHSGGNVINGYAKIGKNCKIHGNNCIGNNGITSLAPQIGDNVDIGVGAKIIGDIYIADNIRIGAGAIVNKSFYEKGITIAGIPAKRVK